MTQESVVYRQTDRLTYIHTDIYIYKYRRLPVGSHVGLGLHVPFDWQVMVASPFSMNPLLQLNVILVPIEYRLFGFSTEKNNSICRWRWSITEC